MIEKLFYTGLGVAATMKQKVESEIQELEKKGKIKTDDAQSFLESIEAKGKEEDQKLKQEIKKTLKEVIDELGLATKEDIQKLKEELK
jgi:polyhydroxyalkanoate synthesis regulator phasin